ncbi:MAG TPA: HAMP domain-containing sensor histidine kinase [Candidatus Eisenbacteria bacterium]|nr:HAMP domain-containing sensor histidine kinase [Candidatus Eisenbacteria bacterium]
MKQTPATPVLVRDSLAEVETQRDDLLVYLSAARSILDVCAGAHGVKATAQELAVVLVRELGVEACAVTLRERADAPLRLVGFAAQSDRFGEPFPVLPENGWVTLARLVGTGADPVCFRRDDDGGFSAVTPTALTSEGFTALPFSVGDERDGVLVLQTIVAPSQLFGRLQGVALLADMVGYALTMARTREATQRLCDRLSGDLGVSRRRLDEREQTLRAREDSITRLTKELVRSNNVKTEFLATVSHELRTPLNAILGYTELLHGGHIGPITGEQSEAIGRVLRAAHNLHLRVEDILFFVQMDADQVIVRSEPIQIAPIVDEVVAALSDRPSASVVALRTEIDPAARTLVTDASLFRRVLFHLLGNAFKFTERGTVWLTIRPAPRPEDALVIVRDSGVGIPPDRQRAIFDAFVQADGSDARRFDGLGMGLALVQRAAHLLGGQVDLESIPGEGSEFTVTLPGALAAESHVLIETTAPERASY